MGNTFRNLLLAAAIGLSMPEAVAQTESFTGPSGNSYYVDYVSGLVMQLHENNATIISPAKVVETEFNQMAIEIDDMSQMCYELILDLQEIEQEIQYLTNIYEDANYNYELATSKFIYDASSALQSYSYLLNKIQNIIASRGASKPAKATMQESQNANTFTFHITELIESSMEPKEALADLMLNITALRSEIYPLHENLTYANDQVNQILDYCNSLNSLMINDHFTYIVEIDVWILENAETADIEQLHQIEQEIEFRMQTLQSLLESIPDNPVDEMDLYFTLSNLDEYIQMNQQILMNTSDYIDYLSDRIDLLISDFCAVIFAGPGGDNAGLYHAILNNNGSLVLPEKVYSGENEYIVKGIDGNIFAGKPVDIAINNLKLIIPETVISISNEAFAIDGIEEVTAKCESVPFLDINCFTEATYANANLYVKTNLLEDYRTDNSWGNFIHIFPETTGVNDLMHLNTEVRIDGNKLIVNAPAQGLISVYTPDGRTIFTGCSNSIELPTKGLYIVKVADKVIKIRY